MITKDEIPILHHDRDGFKGHLDTTTTVSQQYWPEQAAQAEVKCYTTEEVVRFDLVSHKKAFVLSD